MGRGLAKGVGVRVGECPLSPPTLHRRRLSQSQWGLSPPLNPAAAAHSAHKPGQGTGRQRLLRLLSGSARATAMLGAAGVLLVLLLSEDFGGGWTQGLQQLPQAHQQRGTIEARALDYILFLGRGLLTGPI